MNSKGIKVKELVAVLSKRNAPFILPHMRWLCGLSADVRCPTCGRFRNSTYPKPIDIKIYQYARGLACGVLYDFYVGIIYRDLYEELDLDRHGFVMGKCYKGTGELFKKYVSYYTNPRINRYGTEVNKITVCIDCGRMTIQEQGDYFLLSSDIDGRVAVQDYFGDLYVTPKLAGNIDWQKYRSIRPYIFPVRDKALSDTKIHIKRVGKAFFKCSKPEFYTRPGSARWEDWAHDRD